MSANPFVPEDGTARVDAAFVWRGTTYLISGTRYVRYSSPDYRYTDPGYPKSTAGNLRREEPFAQLPETFEDVLAGGVDAVLAGERTVYVFAAGGCHVASHSATATLGLDTVGRVRNNIAEQGRVDAALVKGGRTYLFSGDQYVRYSGLGYETVDEGYPRSLATSLGAELGIPTLPEAFQDGIDAAFLGQDGMPWLFRGRQSLHGGSLEPLAGRWGVVANALATQPLQAAFATPAGELYAFGGGQYVRYSGPDYRTVDQGFPRTVADDFGDLPADFEAQGPDGAFTLLGRTYLALGDRYVRYSGGDFQAVDPTFPQDFGRRWADTADYRLSDVHTVARFAALAREHGGELGAFLVRNEPEPYAKLARLCGWDAEEVRWARRNSPLLVAAVPAEEDRIEIEFLLKLAEVLAVTERLGASPEEVHAAVWTRLYGPAPDPAAAADALYRLLERGRGAEEFTALAARIKDELNVLKRDALVPAVLSLNPGLETTRDLFEQLLIDVEMGAAGRTSRVREAIAACQLYLNRYLLDLEESGLPADADEAAVRERLKTWWGWLKNYRVWEANRKVFLYPENYLRPELRPGKTPAFQALEQDLLQSEITEDGVQQAYKRYLDEYTEVSRLAIAGGYVYRADGDAEGVRQLVLFGRTRTEPRRYYFRTAEFRDGEKLSATWEPWQQVKVQIDADVVDPVHAFGRVFVFWPVVETVAPDSTANTTLEVKQNGDKQAITAPPPVRRVKICYSFRSLDGDWMPAQVLATDTPVGAAITNAGLYVQASREVPGGPAGRHDSIVVTCTYTAGTDSVTSGFALTPELYAVRVAGLSEPSRATRLDRIFLEPEQSPISPAGVVRLGAPAGSLDGPWLSVDHKGGSFLCRPVSASAEPPALQQLRGNGDRLPTTWDRIDAAVELPGATRYFFHSGERSFIAVPDGKDAWRQPRSNTADRFGIVGNNLTRTGVVDSVLVRRDQTFVFSGSQYVRFTGRPFSQPDPGYPKPLAGNTEELPRWSRIDAAVADGDGTEFFFSRERDAYVQSGSLDLLRPVRDRWGLTRFPTCVFTVNRVLFVVTGDQYLRISARDGRPDAGYPKPIAKNPDGLPETRMDTAFGYRSGVYAFDNTAGTYTFRDQGGAPSEPRASRDLGRAETALSRTGAVDAAYVDSGKLFLVTRDEYARYTLGADGSIPATMDEGYPKRSTQPMPVRGVIRRADLTYVVNERAYAELPAGKELDTALEFQPLQGNWGGLPATYERRFTGLLDGQDALFLFLGPEYAAYPKAVAIPRPFEYAALPHEVVRLTSSTAYLLNRELLTGGVAALLAPATQEIDELPAFSTEVSDATTIKVRPASSVPSVPTGSHLDFRSANGLYYWEIFCHAPLLIAQALNAGQRFEDARRWYEYVFDPTEQAHYWRFLPFLAVDVKALAAGCRAGMAALAAVELDRQLGPVLTKLEALAPAFHQVRELTTEEADYLGTLAGTGLQQVRLILGRMAASEPRRSLLERVEMIAGLRRGYDAMGDRDKLIQAYLDDPFSPHAIAGLRPVAYRRSVVMAYIDNLLDWGDALFRRYTAESIDEARMLYVVAYDLLGERPEGVSPPAPAPAATFAGLNGGNRADRLPELTAGGTLVVGKGAVHESVTLPYFHVPDNEVLGDYWSRVEDRLRKIRASLDILGISRPVPLFEPPLDVSALVGGAAAGAGTDLAALAAVPEVPHHRFAAVLRRAQDVTERLRGLGSDLLSVLERRDGEELSLLQSRQEATILTMTREIKEGQVTIAAEQLADLQEAREGALGRVTHYEGQIAAGMSAVQQAQMSTMRDGANAHFVAAGLKLAAAVAHGVPQVLAGPFIMGIKTGGKQFGDALDKTAEVSEAFGEAFSMQGEVLAVQADFERTLEDWRLQLATAKTDVAQLGHQIKGAELQLAAARRELEILERQTAHQEETDRFLREKFTTAELYQWMSGRLSGLYLQTYQLAYDLARSAERAYQFERGTEERFIQPVHWEGRRGGLLAGDGLGLDLERLAQAHVGGDRRGLEITKRISLRQYDPMALVALRDTGRCEFAFTEELFDQDFPGHYGRRLRTLSVSFEGAEGALGLQATLTQLDHKTVLTADPKAVAFLLDPQGSPPPALRGDWRPGQQIALSDLEEGRDNNGLFELRYDDERYLPFEGTGAVARWRLETAGARAAGGVEDVVVVVKYAAEQGGENFAGAVKGMLRPRPAARWVDVAAEFPDEWALFLGGGSDRLTLPLAPEMFPGMSGRQITGIYPTYALANGGGARFLLGGDERLGLTDGTLLRTPGLSIGAQALTLVLDGDRQALSNLGLILAYRAGAQ
ncbi:hemopexin repeat-containing protein [Streptomyces boninensis]|uniref:Tc toxin subunit A-related protein n=1 Tax=Streptomyces boninensis TaxID=2039455 RepID=UPI003B20F034